MKKTKFYFLLSSIIFFLSILLSSGDELSSPSRWKVEDVISQESASSFEISPDGQWVVWVKSLPDKEKDVRIRHLFLTKISDPPETIQLTRGENSESSPKWSPSGRYIGFLSSRKEKDEKEESSATQLWLLDSRGGEPWKITNLQFGIIQYDWIDDEHIIFLAREDRTLQEQLQKEKKDTSFVAEDQDRMPPQRLFLLKVGEKKITRLTENRDQITNFILSPHKKWVLTRNNQSVRYEVDKKIKPKFFLFNREDKSMRELFSDPAFKPNFFAWDKEDKGFYFAVTRSSDYQNEGPGADFLYYFNLESRNYEEVPLDWEWGLFYLGFVVREDGFIASLANGARPKWRRYFKRGNSFEYKELEGKHYPNIYSLAVQENGHAAVWSHTTASQPVQWFAGIIEKNILISEKQITELNSHLKNKTKAKAEVIRWVGALDEEIEGILYYPHNYQEGKKYPLILMIHGGPTGVDMDGFEESWAAYPNLMAQKGAFVLMPNYHGSGGYGQKFAESIKGRYYELEIPDMLRGIDHLIAKGMVDPDRLGTMGWSNGGILSIGLSVWTDRFKVAGIGAADVNWISDYGNCAFGVSFDNYYFKAAPWDELEHYIQKSPIFHLKNMKVPTIIFHGTEDTNVPFGQGWEYYRALQQLEKAPVRFIIFPGQHHGLEKLTHQQRKMEEEISWFDRYLFKSEEVQNAALKKGSPLDIALKLEKVAKVVTAYGIELKGHIIPEVIAMEGLEVGRFEVTRAQWASFDRNFKVEPGKENYPVTGITFADVQKYLNWLNNLTGKAFRLPTVAEAEKLAQKATKEENTLDYWAGYSLNPDDAKLLMEKVRTLKGFASLLLPVDRFQPVGEEMLFGLGGNAAEWAVDEKKKEKAFGQNAITPCDPRHEATPPLEYTGFRVVHDKK